MICLNLRLEADSQNLLCLTFAPFIAFASVSVFLKHLKTDFSANKEMCSDIKAQRLLMPLPFSCVCGGRESRGDKVILIKTVFIASLANISRYWTSRYQKMLNTISSLITSVKILWLHTRILKCNKVAFGFLGDINVGVERKCVFWGWFKNCACSDL